MDKNYCKDCFADDPDECKFIKRADDEDGTGEPCDCPCHIKDKEE